MPVGIGTKFKNALLKLVGNRARYSINEALAEHTLLNVYTLQSWSVMHTPDAWDYDLKETPTAVL